MRANIAASMPIPVSETISNVCGPGADPTWSRTKSSSSSTFWVSSVSLPPSGICFYRHQILRQRHFDLEVFSNDPLQHLQEVSNDVVQIQDAQLKHLLPA